MKAISLYLQFTSPKTPTRESKTFRTFIFKAEKERRRLENILEQQVTSQNTSDMVRCSLEEIRDENLDNASYQEKQELIAKLGIIFYLSED